MNPTGRSENATPIAYSAENKCWEGKVTHGGREYSVSIQAKSSSPKKAGALFEAFAKQVRAGKLAGSSDTATFRVKSGVFGRTIIKSEISEGLEAQKKAIQLCKEMDRAKTEWVAFKQAMLGGDDISEHRIRDEEERTFYQDVEKLATEVREAVSMPGEAFSKES